MIAIFQLMNNITRILMQYSYTAYADLRTNPGAYILKAEDRQLLLIFSANGDYFHAV